MSPRFNISKANKHDKKNVLRFYRQQQYSARFIGLDSCYLIYQPKINNTMDDDYKKRNDDKNTERKIIAAIIVSKVQPNNRYDLLHALVVKKHFQHQGLASQLIQYALNNHESLICFAQQALENLYLNNNFIQIKAENIPAEFQGRYHSCQKKCKTLQAYLSNDVENNMVNNLANGSLHQ